MIATGYKYNSSKVLFFLSTPGAGATTAGKPYIVCYADKHGNMLTRDVIRPQVITKYFTKSNIIDVHNQLRQCCLRLEKQWITMNPWFRLYTSILGMIVVDTYHLANYYSLYEKKRSGFYNMNNEDNDFSVRQFAGILTNQLLIYSQQFRGMKLAGTGLSFRDNDQKNGCGDDVEKMMMGWRL